MVSEWELRNSREVILSLGDFNEHGGNVLRVLNVYMGEWHLEKKCRRSKIVRVL